MISSFDSTHWAVELTPPQIDIFAGCVEARARFKLVEFILAQSILFICNLIMLYFLSICAYNWYVFDVGYIVDLVCVSIDVIVNSFWVNRDSFTGLWYRDRCYQGCIIELNVMIMISWSICNSALFCGCRERYFRAYIVFSHM